MKTFAELQRVQVRESPSTLSLFHRCSLSSRSARGARADLHAPRAPKSKAEMEAEAAAEELMSKHREVSNTRKWSRSVLFVFMCIAVLVLVCFPYRRPVGSTNEQPLALSLFAYHEENVSVGQWDCFLFSRVSFWLPGTRRVAGGAAQN